MTTTSEILSGITILGASLLLRAVSSVSPVGLFRDVLGVFSVLLLLAGIGVLAVGVGHLATRADDGVQAGSMSRELVLATCAVIGVGIGCTVGAAVGGVLAVAIGTAVGAGAGVALAAGWQQRQRSAVTADRAPRP